MSRFLPALNAARPGFFRQRGFSLVELLVAMAVMAILVALMAQLVGSATSTLLSSRRRIEADAQARMVFDRMSLDLVRMVQRADADVVFAKNDGAGTEHNDAFYFLSEAPGFSDSEATTAIASTLALVGYRMTAAPLLERLGKRLAVDGADSAVYLARVPGSASFAPDPESTLAGRWSSVLDTGPAYTSGTDAAYQTLGPLVLRMEFCFLLTDGTFSDKPVQTAAGLKNVLDATAAPTATDDESNGYAIGSRWFDTQSCRGYICTVATPGAALWKPLGTQDVAAMVVGLVILDTKSRQLAETAGGLAAIGETFSDVTASDLAAATPVLMRKKWNRELADEAFARNAGIPQAVAAHLRIYQSFFYLNPRPSNR
jgi:prepilin-type N-terminal cleavage/methylation domain-containing protein